MISEHLKTLIMIAACALVVSGFGCTSDIGNADAVQSEFALEADGGDADEDVDETADEGVSEESISEESISEESVDEESISEESVSVESISEESVDEESISEESVSEESVSEESISEDADEPVDAGP